MQFCKKKNPFEICFHSGTKSILNTFLGKNNQEQVFGMYLNTF